MTKRKSLLQKVSLVSAVICVLLAIASGVMLYLRMQTIAGVDNPISASYLACTFFFACISIVLSVMGSADLPSFKFDK